MKKKILIVTSVGGGGHVTVTAALKEVLIPEYEIAVGTVLEEILAPVDWIQQVTLGKSSGEKFYNYCLKIKANRTINFIAWASNYFFSCYAKKIKRLIDKYLTKTKPDIVISVAPYFNNYIAEVTHAKNIPFILVPTDLDATTFVQGIKGKNHPPLQVAISFNDPEIIQRARVANESPIITGFPLKKAFLANHDREQIKKDFAIFTDRPIILVLMGAQGSQSSLNFARELTQLKQQAHLVFCLGKNEKIKAKIEKLTFPDHVSYTAIGFTSRMADLMAIAQVIITKSGSVSVCEALYMNLPLILDATSPVLKWEKFNHHFIVEHGFGYSLKKITDLSPLLDQLLSSNALPEIRARITRYEKKPGVFEIKKLVDQCLVNRS